MRSIGLNSREVRICPILWVKSPSSKLRTTCGIELLMRGDSCIDDDQETSEILKEQYESSNLTLSSFHRHYLIPLALQQKSKWRKKGLKLHIFGEHTFVAKHMSSSTPCEVCHKTLGRRFGKQGYVCRDCGFKCHKPCHVKTETVCPNSTINTMDL
nr:serine/threonine-protein kinase D2-like [Cherax quadricarinatus]